MNTDTLPLSAGTMSRSFPHLPLTIQLLQKTFSNKYGIPLQPEDFKMSLKKNSLDTINEEDI